MDTAPARKVSRAWCPLGLLPGKSLEHSPSRAILRKNWPLLSVQTPHPQRLLPGSSHCPVLSGSPSMSTFFPRLLSQDLLEALDALSAPPCPWLPQFWDKPLPGVGHPHVFHTNFYCPRSIGLCPGFVLSSFPSLGPSDISAAISESMVMNISHTCLFLSSLCNFLTYS